MTTDELFSAPVTRPDKAEPSTAAPCLVLYWRQTRAFNADVSVTSNWHYATHTLNTGPSGWAWIDERRAHKVELGYEAAVCRMTGPIVSPVADLPGERLTMP